MEFLKIPELEKWRKYNGNVWIYFNAYWWHLLFRARIHRPAVLMENKLKGSPKDFPILFSFCTEIFNFQK